MRSSAPRLVLVAIAALVGTLAGGAARAAYYFGDLHAHSGLSDDATGTPEGFFVAARDIAGLDFVALSDHDAFLTQDEWDILNSTASSFDRPGEFVAFSAVEWTHHWHMNAVFERHDEALCDATVCGFPPDFFEFYGPRVLAGAAAAHINHPADLYKVDWLQIDDTITTSVEVWNTGGAGDNERGFGNALWALRAGYQLGLVGVSDDHATDQQPLRLGTGLTGCDVDSLAPADLLEALRARRCYATSGERIELALDVDGAPMGAELARRSGASLPVTVEVKATATPVLIELLQDGDVVARKRCGTPFCTLASRVRVRQPNGFVYARVTQPGDERAWSSPVWLRGECDDGSACLSARLALGGGPEADDCLAEWLLPWPPLLEPYHRATDQIVCTDGDPRCDFGDAPGECRVRLGLCFGVEDVRAASCAAAVPQSYDVIDPTADATDRESADFQNRQALLAMFQALRPSPGGIACSPLSELRVPVGRRTIATRAEAGGRVDDDELAIECRPARAPSRGRLGRRLAAP
jgi:hypothetical protein